MCVQSLSKSFWSRLFKHHQPLCMYVLCSPLLFCSFHSARQIIICPLDPRPPSLVVRRANFTDQLFCHHTDLLNIFTSQMRMVLGPSKPCAPMWNAAKCCQKKRRKSWRACLSYTQVADSATSGKKNECTVLAF